MYTLFGSLGSKFPSNTTVFTRPNTRLARGNDAIRINRILEDLIELQETTIVPIVCSHNLIHDSQVGSIFAPSICSTVINKGSYQPLYFLLLRQVLLVEHNTNDMICKTIRRSANRAGAEILQRCSGVDIRISLMPTVKVPIKSNPASSHLFLVIAYCIIASSPETFAMGEKNRCAPLGTQSIHLSSS